MQVLAFHIDNVLPHILIGILAGIWPCGVITLLGELYVAESKSQVYGSLHNHIQRNSECLSKLGTCKEHYTSHLSSNREYES